MSTKGRRGTGRRKTQRDERKTRQRERRPRSSQGNRSTLYLFGGVGVLILAVVIFGTYTGIRDAEKVDQLLIDLYQGQDELKISGDEIKFEDILSQGKPTVLNFWGGDCPPCRAEMPGLQRSYETNRDDVIYFEMDSGKVFRARDASQRQEADR